MIRSMDLVGAITGTMILGMTTDGAIMVATTVVTMEDIMAVTMVVITLVTGRIIPTTGTACRTVSVISCTVDVPIQTTDA